MVTVRFPFVSKGFLVKHRLRRSSLRIAAYFFLFYSIYFMFMRRKLMFTVLEYMFTALELMFIDRKHNFSGSADLVGWYVHANQE